MNRGGPAAPCLCAHTRGKKTMGVIASVSRATCIGMRNKLSASSSSLAMYRSGPYSNSNASETRSAAPPMAASRHQPRVAAGLARTARYDPGEQRHERGEEWRYREVRSYPPRMTFELSECVMEPPTILCPRISNPRRWPFASAKSRGATCRQGPFPLTCEAPVSVCRHFRPWKQCRQKTAEQWRVIPTSSGKVGAL